MDKFLNSFEIIKNQPVEPPPPPPQPGAELTSTHPACALFGQRQSGDLDGVPYVEKGFPQNTALRNPSVIVVHHSVTSSGASTAKVLLGKGASIHFNVGRGKNTGVLEQWVRIDKTGAHAGRLNKRSIGVENTSPRGGFFAKSNSNHTSEQLEPLYQLLLKLTKKTGISFRIAEAAVRSGYFFVGKLPDPIIGGVRAHGSDLGTTHTDGRFELLYCHLRLLDHTPAAAIKNARAMHQWALENKNHKEIWYTLETKWKEGTKWHKRTQKKKVVGQKIVQLFKVAYIKVPPKGTSFQK